MSDVVWVLDVTMHGLVNVSNMDNTWEQVHIEITAVVDEIGDCIKIVLSNARPIF
jgi:hypothetical protein